MKDWEDELLDGATLEKKGTFTLAMEKARQKLEKFQLPDPTLYILQILQAIIASGAAKVTMKHDHSELMGRSTLSIWFDGPGYSRHELTHLNDYVFESGRSREKDRTREMALGIVSCLALKPSLVRLASQGLQWERKAQQEQVVEVPGVQGNLFEVVRSGRAPETELLRVHCLNCPIDLTLNDRLICTKEGSLQSPCPWPNFGFRYGEFYGSFGIGYGQLEKSSLTLMRYGIQFTRRLESRVYPPLVLVCEHPDLRKNASQSDVVEDANYLKFIAELGRVQRDFSFKLATDRIPGYQRELVQHYLLSYFEQFLPSNLTSLEIEALEPDLQKILSLPLFAGTTGDRFPLSKIMPAYRQDGMLLVSHRIRPRAKIKDLVVLCPSEWEQALLTRVFENIVNVDERFDEILSEVRGRRALNSVELPTMLAEISVGNLTLAIPDAPLDSQIYFYRPSDEGLYHRQPLPLTGLSAVVYLKYRDGGRLRGMPEEEVVREVKPHLASLYLRLWERLRQANRKPKFAAKIARATDHFANALNYFGRSSPNAPPVAEEFWKARFLEDRQGRLVSLADVETWLAVYPQVSLTLGGPVHADDYALKSSPEIRRLLSAVFGADKVLEATLEKPCLKEREQQRPLAGCADGPALQLVHEETEEEEMARLKAEYEQAKRGEGEVAAPQTRPAAPTPATSPPVEPEQEEHVASMGGPLEAPALTEAEAYLEHFRHITKFVSTTITGPGKSGSLALCANYSHPRDLGWVTVLNGPEPGRKIACPGLPVCGWLAQESGEIGEAEVQAALIQLYHEAATQLQVERLEPGAEQLLRRLILQVFIQRPHFAQIKGPMTEVPLMSLRNGQLISLGELRRNAIRFGFLPYCYPGDSLPKGEMNVLVLTPPVTQELLHQLFRVSLMPMAKGTANDGREALLRKIRHHLADLAQIPDTRLEVSLVEGVGWGEPTRWFGSRKKYFVEHLRNGLTELNPGHSLVKSILRSKDGPERMAPVLASSVYTAINRALHEIEDVHELAFLEALLDRLERKPRA